MQQLRATEEETYVEPEVGIRLPRQAHPLTLASAQEALVGEGADMVP